MKGYVTAYMILVGIKEVPWKMDDGREGISVSLAFEMDGDTCNLKCDKTLSEAILSDKGRFEAMKYKKCELTLFVNVFDEKAANRAKVFGIKLANQK